MLLTILFWIPAVLADLPDFSHAGYRGGDAEIPGLAEVCRIAPIAGDNTAHIQSAIDMAGHREPDAMGYRGAIVLEAGLYRVCGTIRIPYSGIVLRGVGYGEDTLSNTVLRATGDTPHRRDVVVVGTSSRIWGQTETEGTKQYITDDSVVCGSKEIHVANAQVYHVGEPLIIYHPCTKEWLQAVDFGGVPYPDPSNRNAPDERWTEGQLPIVYHRYITAIEGNCISIDAPVFYTLRKSLSAMYVYVPNMKGTVMDSGIENLRIEVESEGGTDENHAWNTLRFRSAENVWARECTFVGFGHSGIITEACRRSTFVNCSAIDPVGIVTGERMYNFNTYLHSQLNLFSHCYARNGRHHYVSNGTSTTSGNVFLYCVSDSIQNANEGHRQWTQGMLYDGHKEQHLRRKFVLGLYNRVAMGTGHGWAAVNSVLWNCDADADYGVIGLQQPPTANNWAIGCKVKEITGTPVKASSFPLGYVEGTNMEGLEIPSLYLYQLNRRRNGMNVVEVPAANKTVRQWNKGCWCISYAGHLYLPTGQCIY